MICIDCRRPDSVALPDMTMCDRCLDREREQLQRAREQIERDTQAASSAPSVSHRQRSLSGV